MLSMPSESPGQSSSSSTMCVSGATLRHFATVPQAYGYETIPVVLGLDYKLSSECVDTIYVYTPGIKVPGESAITERNNRNGTGTTASPRRGGLYHRMRQHWLVESVSDSPTTSVGA
jgi:hypothetical protein